MTRIKVDIVVSRVPDAALFAELMGQPSSAEDTDSWRASSGLRESSELSEIVEYLLERTDLQRLRDLVAENGLKVALECKISLEGELPLIGFEPDLIAELHALGASLEIELEPAHLEY